MAKNFVIYGDTGFAEEIYKIISFEGRDNVIAFTNDRSFLNKAVIEDLPVIPFDELSNSIDKPFEILLAYGYTQMNNLREKVFNECVIAGVKVGVYVSTKATCYTDIIGEGTMIWPNVYLGPGVKVGRCNIIKAAVTIAHDNEIGDFNYIAPGVVLGGRSSLANHCFIGLNATVKSGVLLSDYTLLGSSCNMLKDSELRGGGGGYIGNPARRLEKSSLELKI